MEKLSSLKSMVESCLKEYPDTRNSDKLLTWKIWQVFYEVDGSVELKDFMALPSEDNVKRIRAYFQNSRKFYLPTSEEVAKQRKHNIEEWKNFIREGR